MGRFQDIRPGQETDDSSIRWRTASHACGISVKWARIGRRRAVDLLRGTGLARNGRAVPRMGYQADVLVSYRDALWVAFVANEGGRFTVQLVRPGGWNDA